MRRTLRSMLTVAATVAAVGGLGVGNAHADDVLSGLLSPLVCGLQNNVNGDHNQVSQGATCHQSSTPAPPTSGGGITGYEVIQFDTVTLSNSTATRREGSCPAGKRALSGGATTTGYFVTGQVIESGPTAGGTGWIVGVSNDAPTPVTWNLYIVCANVAS